VLHFEGCYETGKTLFVLIAAQRPAARDRLRAEASGPAGMGASEDRVVKRGDDRVAICRTCPTGHDADCGEPGVEE